MAPHTVVVTGGSHAQAEQILIVVHGLDRTQEQKELGVFIRRFSPGTARFTISVAMDQLLCCRSR